MSRTLWKGAISFGLLNAPVALYPASRQDEIDFDWLSRKGLKPVGYKRVVKDTGEEIGSDEIVRAVRHEGRYVVLSDEEIRSANVKSTHTIDIVTFTDVQDLSFLYFETPYYLAPTQGGEKVYALLREALLETRKVGIALIVIHNKQHLAALIPTPDAIVLNTLRWATEVKDTGDLDLPARGTRGASIRQKELTMATELIESMSEEWDPTDYRDTFRDDIMALVKKKAEQGQAEQITAVAEEAPAAEESGVDLAELLRRSLQGRRKPAAGRSGEARAAPPAAHRASRSRSPKTAH